MKDSFNNKIQVGDRILCIEPREFNNRYCESRYK